MLPPGRAVRFAPPQLGHPRAAVIAALGGVARGAARASQLATLMPHYLRPCDAEAATREAVIRPRLPWGCECDPGFVDTPHPIR